MAITTLQGCLIVNGLARNGITVNLYDAGSFTGAPSGGNVGDGGTALPSGGILQTTTTGPQHGGDGAYRFTVASSGQWYAGINFNGFYTWDYHSLAGDGSIAVNVKNYGAVGAGTNVDDTAAFNLAISAVTGQGGGDVYVPPGKYAVNLTLTSNNVRLVGTSQSVSGTTTNCLVPYATGSPVIQVGNDTAFVADVRLDNLTLFGVGPNGTGNIGLYLAGGALRTNIRNLSSTSFITNSVKVQGGTSYPAELIWFDQCQFQPSGTCLDAGVLVAYPATGSQWTTDIFFDNCQFYSPSISGYAWRVDSAQIYAANSFVNAVSNHGVKFTNNSAASSPPTPNISAVNLGIDSGNSSATLVETYNTNDAIPIYGTFSINGKFKLSDATLQTVDFSQHHTDRVRLISPVVRGSLCLVQTEATANTSHQLYASSNQLWVQSSGNIRISPSNGDGTGLTTHSGILDTSAFRIGSGIFKMWAGTGTPEGQSFNGGTAQPSGSIYHRTDAPDPGRMVYVKITSGSANGWRPITEHIPTTIYTAASITGAIDDQVICCSGTTAVRLPATPSIGRTIEIKDAKGNASGANIVITPAAGTIDGAATKTISTNYGYYRLVYNSSEWNVLGSA